MRCLALSQAWNDGGGHSVFATTSREEKLEQRLDPGTEMIRLKCVSGSNGDAREVAELSRQGNEAWLVVDGYQFNGDYQRELKRHQRRFLYIDDYGHAEYYCADFILNQNLHAADSIYKKREPYTRLLLGTRYALLRRDFSKWQGWRRMTGRPCKILVTLGGGDDHGMTLKVIEALGKIGHPELEAVIVTGASNPQTPALERAARNSGLKMDLKKNVTNMPELMAGADLAIAASGTTSWELAMMQLPVLGMVLADNQKDIAESLARAGVSVNLGWYENVSVEKIVQNVKAMMEDPEKRENMTASAHSLVDGLGANRVCHALEPSFAAVE